MSYASSAEFRSLIWKEVAVYLRQRGFDPAADRVLAYAVDIIDAHIPHGILFEDYVGRHRDPRFT